MKAILALEDGFFLEGSSFVGECESGGEVIFNTGMGGYQELLTDPSHSGQMLCLTYPLIGNYGINPFDSESTKVHVQALLVKECCHTPSNWQATMSLADFLVNHNVPGVEGLDTRALTLHLRRNGAMRGVVSTTCSSVADLVNKAKALPSMQGQNLVDKVAPKSAYVWRGDKVQNVDLEPNGACLWQKSADKRKYKLLVYDFGIKWNILRLLDRQDFDMLVVPPSFSYEQAVATGAEAIFLSNGPGDPGTLTNEIKTIEKLCDKFPVAGICLGHQLLGHALGGTTKKMKFGHHGCNHPVKDLETGKIEISSQNHGFCVENPKLTITHVNLNDGSLEGFAHPSKPVIAIQHYPEAAPDPNDSRYFFRRFKKLIG